MSTETFDFEDFKENERQSRLRLDKLKKTWAISNQEERAGMIRSAEKYLATHKSSRNPDDQSVIDAYTDFLEQHK